MPACMRVAWSFDRVQYFWSAASDGPRDARYRQLRIGTGLAVNDKDRLLGTICGGPRRRSMCRSKPALRDARRIRLRG